MDIEETFSAYLRVWFNVGVEAAVLAFSAFHCPARGAPVKRIGWSDTVGLSALGWLGRPVKEHLIRASAALATASVLTAYSVLRIRRSPGPMLRLAGSLGFVIVGAAHVCESLHVFPIMGWGEEHSVGHYLDLSGGLFGIVLFPAGVVISAFSAKRRD